MQQSEGTNNANSIFGVHQIPSDAQIRNLLDNVLPETLFTLIDLICNALFNIGYIDAYRWISLLSLDGTDFFSPKKISCSQCTLSQLKNGSRRCRHSSNTCHRGTWL
jgi:hypothetical protein